MSGDVPRHVTLAGQPLLALTHDRVFFATLKKVADPAHEVRAIAKEVDLSSALLAHHAGVLVLDTVSLTTPAAHLVTQLQTQFPDVVIIVAGDHGDQAALAREITDGAVYRFLQKPISEQRVRLFVEAAWRRHAEAQAGLVTSTFAALGVPRSSKWWVILGLVGALAAAGWYAVDRQLIRFPATALTPAMLRPAASTGVDVAFENLLSRADRALAAGQIVTPPGTSAADLYREALRRNPRDPRALSGIEQVIDRLLTDAEALLQDHHLDGAQQLAEEARAISPTHPRVAFLIGQIGAQRERAVLDKAQRAASAGNVAGALAVLDDATRGGRRSTLVDTARQQLAQRQQQQQASAGVADFLKRARDATAAGQLVEPAENNARFFIESARALAPGDPAVRDAAQDLSARLAAEAGKALTAGNPDQADRWTAAAADSGAAPQAVATLRADAQRLRGANKASAVANLAQAFNERLDDGRLTEPAGDSAQFYLAKLTQADPENGATQLARTAYGSRVLDQARTALHAQDYALAHHWLTEARSAGADAAAIGEIDAAVSSAQEEAQRAASYVSASSLTRTRYVSPDFPLGARKGGTEGWVDLQFLVNTDGSVNDVMVVGAQPVGVFEQAAIDAVRHWHYQPVKRAGQAVSQRARVRLRFAMQR